MLTWASHMQIQPCPIKSTHPWERCCYAHPHENARRRDPRQYRYIAEPCPDYKRGICLLVSLSIRLQIAVPGIARLFIRAQKLGTPSCCTQCRLLCRASLSSALLLLQ